MADGIADQRLTAQQRELIEIAATLGREKFAPRAMQVDRDAVFPFENYADMREAGLLKICVPREHGGLGADFSTYVMVAAEIGRHCGATGLTWNMHVCSTMWAGFIADALDMTPEQRAQAREKARAHWESMTPEQQEAAKQRMAERPAKKGGN